MSVKHKLDSQVVTTVKLLYTLIFMGVILTIHSCNKNTTQKNESANVNDSLALIYYCPMHPNIVQNHPGKCPIKECNGMDLVLKIDDDHLVDVIKPVNNNVLAAIKTVKPIFIKKKLDFTANGIIEYDIRAERNIISLVSGRIEKLYIKYPFQPVQKGQKLFEIYSPELVAAQENYLYAIANDSSDQTLITAIKQKLLLLGFRDLMFKQIENSKLPLHTVSIYSPFNGYAYAMRDSENVMTSTSNVTDNNYSSKELPLKEGNYVMMGEPVINIVSTADVAAIIQVKPFDISKIKVGEDVAITINSDSVEVRAKIDFIEPFIKLFSKFIRVRIYLKNPDNKYKVGSVLNVKIAGNELETLWVPQTSIVDLGTKKIVWLKSKSSFRAAIVETGVVSNNMIEISDGLTEESEIALEGHYLTDSESFINTNEDEK